MDWKFFNVILLGIAFMFVFTAFQTCQMIEQIVLEGAYNGTFKGSGYTSLCIIYGVFATSNWVAPSIVAVCGAKLSMILGGVIYTTFIVSFLKPMVWSLYSASVLLGFGAAIIWTGQGNYLTVNSDANTIGRNSGIFWALMQCSLFFGNLFIYFEFAGEENKIEDHTRITVYIVLSSVCAFGVLLMIFLRTRSRDQTEMSVQGSEPHKSGPVQALVNSFKLFATKEMALLAVVFAYTGLEMTFFGGVYGTCVAHTEQFTNSKSLAGLTGIFIGVGEVLGGFLFGIVGKKTNKYGRDPVILLGFLVHTACFYLIFLNLPQDSPFQETTGSTYITPNEYIAVGCAFLLGFGDSCYNTQIYSLLGHCYSKNSSSAFALYKFVQSLAAAAAFFYTQPLVKLLLQYQLLILVVGNVLAAVSFFAVETMGKTERNEGYSPVPQSPKSDEEDTDERDEKEGVSA